MMKRLLTAILVIPVALVVAFVARAGATPATAISGTGTGCDSSAPYPQMPNRLYAVSGTSASDVWAVGIGSTSVRIMHWDGCAWSVTETSVQGNLEGVSAVSPADAWAVGSTDWWNPVQTLALHWDGMSWTQVSTPVQGGSAVFNAVAATSAANAWAVGWIGPGHGIVATANEPLIEHWDGTAWSAQSFAVPPEGGQFWGVAANSASNAWAVGWTGGNAGTGQATLIEHWDGSTWTRVSSPNQPGTGNMLHGVAIVSASDVWAVGQTSTTSTDQPLIMHWDGSTWTLQSGVPSPTGDTALSAVTADSSDDAWATGLTNPTQCGHGPKCGTIALRWDGSTWTPMPPVDPPSSYLNALLGVAAISGTDVWAVGTTDYSDTLIEHWDGHAWRD